MRLLFDENLSPELPRMLANEYPGSVHVRELGLRGAEGRQIWDYGRAQGFAIVVSIQQREGIRRLTLVGQQSAPELTPAVEDRIVNWLDNLSSQPTVHHSN